MCCYLLESYLVRFYVQKCRRFVSNIRLGYVVCGFGLIALLEFFGAFVHPFEVSYDENFAYPYEGNIHEFVSALRHNEKPEVEPINEYKHVFLLDQSQKCKEEDADDEIRLVFVVKSALENFDRRIAIRNSWGIEKRFFDVPARTVFIVGTHPNDGELDARLKLEAAVYKDVVQAEFTDSYYNNTIKTMMGFKWLVKYCPNSKFYMFVDDDMYVSMKNVATFIKNPGNYPLYLIETGKVYSAHKREIKPSDLMYYEETNSVRNATYTSEINDTKSFIARESSNENTEKNEIYEKREDLGLNTSVLNRTRREILNFDPLDDTRMFAGFVFMRSSPQRHKFSKWYVPLKEYPYNLWPPYVTAGAYILSKEALLDLYYASLYTKHFRFDDIYLGLVAKKANIVPFHCEEFHFYKKAYTKYSYKYVIASHGYGDSNELLEVWNEQKNLGNA